MPPSGSGVAPFGSSSARGGSWVQRPAEPTEPMTRLAAFSQAGHRLGRLRRTCTHDPPAALLDPNGATPLPDGGMLVTEIGGWVDRLDAHGRLVYSIRTPTSYPSDAQLLPDGNVLVAGFNTPGRVDILTPTERLSGRTARLRRGIARPAFARGALAERDDRRDGRLASPDRRDRSADEAHRVAVRPLRHRPGPPRIPRETGRARPVARGEHTRLFESTLPPARRHSQSRHCT